MATLETQYVDAVIANTRRKMLTMGGAALAGLAMAGSLKAQTTTTAYSDFDILNFALSLEFLGAQYYSLGLNGVSIDNPSNSTITPTGAGGTGTAGTVTGGSQVTFATTGLDPLIKQFVSQLLADEIGHITSLQSVLGSSAVAQANIDFTAFGPFAVSASLPSGFNPFTGGGGNFLLGAFVFEDNDTAAYHGAAPLISNKALYLPAAVAIHAVEAQHSGLIRSLLLQLDGVNGNSNYEMDTQKVAAHRNSLATAADSTDMTGDVGIQSFSAPLEGTTGYTTNSLVDNDTYTGSSATGEAYARSATQVLAVVTNGNSNGANTTTGVTYSGGFFPNGLNGTIK